MNFTYNHVSPVQFLRTTYKAGPLLALGLACLAGAAWRGCPGRRRWPRPRRGRGARGGRVPGRCHRPRDRPAADLRRGARRRGGRPPATWTAASGTTGAPSSCRASCTATTTGAARSTRSCPRSPSGPSPSATPCPYADLRAVDLLWTTDALVQQRRALPGQLDPLLDLLGARTVVSGRRRRPPPQRRGAARRGRRRARPARSARTSAGARCGPSRAPRARSERRGRCRGCVPGTARGRGRSCGWRPTAGRPCVDGSADGAGRARGVRRAAARPAAWPTRATSRARELRRAADGGEVVITDSNRRRVVAAARMAQNHGATLAADEPLSPDAAVLDLFPARGTDGQTVAVYEGARYAADAVLARLLAVPRAAPVRGLRRRPGDALAGRPRARAGAALARDRLRRAARRRRDRAAAVLRPARRR